jgi:hypothetical protein
MNADLTLTAYDKQTEYLCKVFVLPTDLLGYARDIASVPGTDPDILGVYPLTEQQAEAIAKKADVPLEIGEYDYCLETIARDERPQVHRA